MSVPVFARSRPVAAVSRIRNNADIQARRLSQVDSWIAERGGARAGR